MTPLCFPSDRSELSVLFWLMKQEKQDNMLLKAYGSRPFLKTEPSIEFAYQIRILLYLVLLAERPTARCVKVVFCHIEAWSQ